MYSKSGYNGELSHLISILEPAQVRVPLVFSSPHSGSLYPSDFVQQSHLDRTVLRKSEDCFIDEIFSAAISIGAPLLRALFPRAYLDLNREPYELDPGMFTKPLPDYVNTNSPRVAAGLGTIARIVSSREEIYHSKLEFADAEQRIERLYKPYHKNLLSLINRARDLFGYCILIDCHSMPSSGLPTAYGKKKKPIDIVLGDRHGISSAPDIIDMIEQYLVERGYLVTRNNPYAGGFTTQRYGNPANGVHAVQIEINRRLYMDEKSLQRSPGLNKLRRDFGGVMKKLAASSEKNNKTLRFSRQTTE